MIPNTMNPMGLNRKPKNDCLPDGTFDTTPRAIIRGGPCLINGNYMFASSTYVERVEGNFANMTTAMGMFDNNNNLMSCNAAFPNLTVAGGTTSLLGMFGGSTIKTFTSELPKLKASIQMFRGCLELTSVTSEFPSLLNSHQMFASCYKLTSVTSEFPSLLNGEQMFDNCVLLKEDFITAVIASLPSYTSGTHTIGFKDVPALTQSHIDNAEDKGWTVRGTPQA